MRMHIGRMSMLIGAWLAIVATAEAAVMDVAKIRVVNNLAHSSTLQVNEIIAIESVSGNDVALATAGATVVASAPLGAPFFASNVIDGVISTGFGFYHGAFSSSDFVEVTLAAPTTLDSLTIVGRLDGCCPERDSYIMQLFNSGGDLLFTEALDGRSAGAAGVTSQLQAAPAPAPATVALLFAGLGLAGLFRRPRESMVPA